MKLPRRNFLHLAAGAAALPAVARLAWAQTYPTRPVRIIVPFPAGLATDTIARLMGQSLSERLGQPFVIENRTGAGDNIGTESVVRATPDGHTRSCLLGCRTRCTRHVLACKIESLAAPSRRSGRRFWVAGKGPEVRLGGPSSSQTLESRSMLSRKIACIRRTTENLDGRARFVSPSGIYRETYALSPIMRDITLAAKLARFFLRGLQ